MSDIHQIACCIGSDVRSGESLTLFSSSWKDRLSSNVVAGTRTIDRRVPVRLLNFLWNRLEWPPVETLAVGPFDVVQSLHPLLIPTRGAAQVVTIHDLHFLDTAGDGRPETHRDFSALVASHARRAHAIVVISTHTGMEVKRRLGVPASRIVRAYPGAPNWRRREREPANGCILFLGTLEPRKNLGTLLDAYERLLATMPDAPPLVLAGGIPASAATLVSRAKTGRLAGRVSFPGYIDDEGRRSLFESATLFVLPSHTEGFGMPVVEAMTCGVPVIVANRGALPEVAGSAGRLIDPDDAEALARALRELLSNADERRRMSDAGVRQAQQFTWTAAADRMRDAWALAVEEQRRRG